MNFFKKFLLSFCYKTSAYSQAGQDLFALELFGKRGTYIDIGAGHPTKGSNSYLLEAFNEWRGFSVELSRENKFLWDTSKIRKNKIYWEDATTFDYSRAIIENKLSNDVDFLSCDIDPQFKTLLALKKLINDGIRPAYVAFETDQYKIDTNYSELARLFLEPHGYKVGVKNIYSNLKKNKIFETWFVKKSLNYNLTEYSNWVNKYKN